MNSPIPYFGGKTHLLKHILPLITKKHRSYIEPFAGSATVLFAKLPSELEVYNDLDKRVHNFFRCLRDYPEELIEELQLTPYSRDTFEVAKLLRKKRFPAPEDMLVNATHLYVLAHQGMSGDIAAGGWSYGTTKNPVPKWLASIEKLAKVALRLKDVQVENIDALRCIRKYDNKEALFYIDPPYVWKTRSGGKYMTEFHDHYSLLGMLEDIKGMFILSGYHDEKYDKYAKENNWHIKNIETVSQATPTTISTGLKGEGSLKENQQRIEVLWWNENLEDRLGQLTIFDVIGR